MCSLYKNVCSCVILHVWCVGVLRAGLRFPISVRWRKTTLKLCSSASRTRWVFLYLFPPHDIFVYRWIEKRFFRQQSPFPIEAFGLVAWRVGFKRTKFPSFFDIFLVSDYFYNRFVPSRFLLCNRIIHRLLIFLLSLHLIVGRGESRSLCEEHGR